MPIVSNEKCKNMFLSAGRHEVLVFQSIFALIQSLRLLYHLPSQVIPDIFMCAGYEGGHRDSCQVGQGLRVNNKTLEN